MSYMCMNGKNKECDGCMECKQQEYNDLYCDECLVKIKHLDNIYYINGKTYCEDCMKALFESQYIDKRYEDNV